MPSTFRGILSTPWRLYASTGFNRPSVDMCKDILIFYVSWNFLWSLLFECFNMDLLLGDTYFFPLYYENESEFLALIYSLEWEVLKAWLKEDLDKRFDGVEEETRLKHLQSQAAEVQDPPKWKFTSFRQSSPPLL